MYIFILSFTTSHVTVYLCYIALAPLSQLHFNTSHVTVYRELKSSYFTSLIISIHLMLLFIGWNVSFSVSSHKISIHLMLLFIVVFDLRSCPNVGFQYISCYCLSASVSHAFSVIIISIHLMLLFIFI